MDPVTITVHGAITYGHGYDHTTVTCPTCNATHSHTVGGCLSDDTTPVTVTCFNGHDIPIPDGIDTRQLLFIVAMRAE